MKKIFYFVFSILLINSNLNAQTLTKEDFRNDILIENINQNVDKFKSSSRDSRDNDVRLAIDSMIHYSNMLIDKYGENNIKLFLEELVIESRKLDDDNGKFAGDKCKRNNDGTVNWSECNTWENIVATVSVAINCYRPRLPIGVIPTPAQTNAYYDCVQERICKNC